MRLLPLGAPPYNPLLSLKLGDLGKHLIGREQFHHDGAPRGVIVSMDLIGREPSRDL